MPLHHSWLLHDDSINLECLELPLEDLSWNLDGSLFEIEVRPKLLEGGTEALLDAIHEVSEALLDSIPLE